jgi:hypothetical protein
LRLSVQPANVNAQCAGTYGIGVESRRIAMRISANMETGSKQLRSSRARSSGLYQATLAMLLMTGVGCATAAAPPVNDVVAQRLAEVSAAAGKPVSSFRYMGQTQFEPIGLSDLLVYTNPREAWLLHLDGPCRNLDFGPFLGLTSHMHRVSSGEDKVLVRDNPIPCRIVQIRPVDTTALKHVEKDSKDDTQPPTG